MGLGFPCCIFTYSYSIIVFSSGNLTLLSSHVYLVPGSEFWHEFLAHHALVLSLEEVIIEYCPSRIFLLCRACSHELLQRRSLKRLKLSLLRPRAVSSSSNTEFHDLVVTVMKIARAFTPAARPSLLHSLRSSNTAFLFGPSITSSRKLSLMLSNHCLDFLCFAILFLQQTLEWLKVPMRTRDFDYIKKWTGAGDHGKGLCIIFLERYQWSKMAFGRLEDMMLG